MPLTPVSLLSLPTFIIYSKIVPGLAGIPTNCVKAVEAFIIAGSRKLTSHILTHRLYLGCTILSDENLPVQSPVYINCRQFCQSEAAMFDFILNRRASRAQLVFLVIKAKLFCMNFKFDVN